MLACGRLDSHIYLLLLLARRLRCSSSLSSSWMELALNLVEMGPRSATTMAAVEVAPPIHVVVLPVLARPFFFKDMGKG